MSRQFVVIDWRGYKPPAYDPAKHDACEHCGFRIRWWSTQHNDRFCDRKPRV